MFQREAQHVFDCAAGFGFVEFLATCPTNWKMTPVAANERIAKAMIPEFPLGVYKDVADTKE